MFGGFDPKDDKHEFLERKRGVSIGLAVGVYAAVIVGMMYMPKPEPVEEEPVEVQLAPQPEPEEEPPEEAGEDEDAAKARQEQLLRLRRVGRRGGYQVSDAVALLRAHEGRPEQTEDLHALVEGLEAPGVAGLPLDALRVACATLLDSGADEGFVTTEDREGAYLMIHALIDGLSFQLAVQPELDVDRLRAKLEAVILQLVRA